MSDQLTESWRWTGGRWWAWIALVFASQLGLIFWLGKPRPVGSTLTEPAPLVRLVGSGAAQLLAFSDAPTLLALTDPTLFALPHREGFSGAAWLTLPELEFRPYVWSEAPRPLALAPERLGADFREFMATNRTSSLPVVAQPEFELLQPKVVESETFPTQSTLRLIGALAGRSLLVSPALPSWPSGEMLTNSVVQVLVAANGKPVSAILLRYSGLLEADQHALREARNGRFQPVNFSDPTNSLAGLSWGQMVFEWHTLPLPATNNTVAPLPPK
jgi:hypothetical protein